MKLKKQRQDEARVRQAAYDALTPQQKLAKLAKGGHRAAREVARILRKNGLALVA